MAQRLARLANALSLRRVLRRRQSQRRPQSDDGSTPASSSSYRRRSGVLRTLRTSWPRPRRNWSPSPDLIFLNASGCCQGRDLPRLMQAFRERFGIRFGRCLELLQAPATSPAGPRYGAPVSTDVQGTRSKAAAAPHTRVWEGGVQTTAAPGQWSGTRPATLL